MPEEKKDFEKKMSEFIDADFIKRRINALQDKPLEKKEKTTEKNQKNNVKQEKKEPLSEKLAVLFKKTIEVQKRIKKIK